MKNKTILLLLLFFNFFVHSHLLSQGIDSVSEKVDALFVEDFSSVRMSVKNTTDSHGIEVKKYSAILGEDLLLEVYEYQENIEQNCKNQLLENKIYLMDFVKSEFTTSEILKDEDYVVSAIITSNLPDKKNYFMGSSFYADELLYNFTFMTTKEEVYELGKEKYAHIFYLK